MKLYDVVVKTRNDEDFNLSSLKGKVLLIVNTATGCGFTPQYEGLEYLYGKYKDKGLEILDFPCDQFGHQAPGTDSEIHEFCTLKYNTTFDQFKKIDVNGENESPLFKVLKDSNLEDTIEGLKNKIAMAPIRKISVTCKKKNDIAWNFTKFLVDRNGNIVKRYSPTYNPKNIEKEIEELLNEQ